MKNLNWSVIQHAGWQFGHVIDDETSGVRKNTRLTNANGQESAMSSGAPTLRLPDLQCDLPEHAARGQALLGLGSIFKRELFRNGNAEVLDRLNRAIELQHLLALRFEDRIVGRDRDARTLLRHRGNASRICETAAGPQGL